MRTNTIASISAAVALALFAVGSSFASSEKIPSNANDHFVTKPNNGNKIDLGATIEIDDKGYPTKQSQQTLFDEMDFQGAVSAYLQSIPTMALYGSVKTNDYCGPTEWSPIYLTIRILMKLAPWFTNTPPGKQRVWC